MSIQWDNSGPVKGRTWIDLVRPASGESVKLICIGEQIEGLWLHWIDGKTIPCTGEDEGCPYHRGDREGELRWKGYFAAVRAIGTPIVYGEVTEEAWKCSPLLVNLSQQRALRGVRVTLFRKRGGPRRPVIVVMEHHDEVVGRADLLPKCPDVRRAVSVLWGAQPSTNGHQHKKAESES